ncbi:amidase family protein [Burkholderia thailandensis]|uniref:amidase family protein n=1 Tax=Burkholderia thailandensis TaxID=57975 RepID=UPI00298F623F|nr:amidase family protein [Burkholderia thailandensis]
MTDEEMVSMSASQALFALHSGALRLVDYLGALLRRAARMSALNAFRVTDPVALMAHAERWEQHRSTDTPPKLLSGLPVGVKDSINSRELPTANGTALLREHRPSRDAKIVTRLHELGGLLFGKTNVHELSFGWTSSSEAYGDVLNPYDPLRIPGEAVAVAQWQSPLELCHWRSLRIRSVPFASQPPCAVQSAIGPALGAIPTVGLCR